MPPLDIKVCEFQAELNTWNEIHKIAPWLAVSALAISLVEAVSFWAGQETSIRSTVLPLGLVALGGLIRLEARQRIRTIGLKLPPPDLP